MAFFESVIHKDEHGDELCIQASEGLVEVEALVGYVEGGDESGIDNAYLVFSAAEARRLAGTLLTAAATSESA